MDRCVLSTHTGLGQAMANNLAFCSKRQLAADRTLEKSASHSAPRAGLSPTVSVLLCELVCIPITLFLSTEVN